MRHGLIILTGAILSLLSLVSTAQAENQNTDQEPGFFSDAGSGSVLTILVGNQPSSVDYTSGTFFVWHGDLYTDPATQTTANATLSGVDSFLFEGFDITFHHVRIFGPGNYSFDLDCTVEHVEAGIIDCPVVPFELPDGSLIPEGRILNLDVGPGQIGAHVLGRWGIFAGPPEFSLVQLWDINTTFRGNFFNLVSVETDTETDINGDGIAGGRLVGAVSADTTLKLNFNLNLEARFPFANASDADGDGIPDDQDIIDNLVTATQQQGLALEGGNFLLLSDSGTLTLGDVAAIEGLSSGVYQTIVGADSLGVVDSDANAICLGGCFNFVINRPSPQVNVVLPLSEALPANAVMRNFVKGVWTDFDSSSANLIASALGTVGSCPGVADSGWTEGLSEGNFCLKLTLTEGGVNDADGATNNIFRGTVGVSEAQTTDDSDNNDSDTSNGGGGCTVGKARQFDIVWGIFGLILLLKCIRRRA